MSNASEALVQYYKNWGYTMKIDSPRYNPVTLSFKDTVVSRVNLVPSKVIARFVLTWDTVKPLDLDLIARLGKKSISKLDRGSREFALFSTGARVGQNEPEIIEINSAKLDKGTSLVFVKQDSTETLGTFLTSKATVTRFINGETVGANSIKDAENIFLIELVIPSDHYYWLLYCFDEGLQNLRVVNRILIREPTVADCN